MFTITVGPRAEGIHTADGSHMTVITSTIEVNGVQTALQESGTLVVEEEIGIQIRAKDGVFDIPITISLQQAIRVFLQEYQGKQDIGFDCYAFAHLVHGVPLHSKSLLQRFWDIESGHELVPGGVIFLLNVEESRFHHAALYVGMGIFISVYGAGGDLEFSTLPQMLRDFPGTEATLALPRNAQAPT